MGDNDEDLGAVDPTIPEEGPTAPPPGWLDCVSGYEAPTAPEGPDMVYPPPPAYNPQPEYDKNASVPNVRVPNLSEDVAREALLKFVESKWSKSSKPARNLTFKELRPLTIYRYRLETYTESRSSEWECEPFTGAQYVDGPQYGASPSPWDIQLVPPPKFTNQVQKTRVPHSSFVKVCHRCQGCGRTRCVHCFGRGMKRCTFCHGHGHRGVGVGVHSAHHGMHHGTHHGMHHGMHHGIHHGGSNRCTSCHGRGMTRCFSCQGHGYSTCLTCQGATNVLHFIQLTATWKNNVFVFVPDRHPEFPLKKFEKVQGDPFFMDESVLVYPIVGFPDQDICDASRRANQQHFSTFTPISRILQQRQTIELVPLTHAFYTYRGKDYDYFVYGLENKVFTPKYPSACTLM